jgi:hypothetical protein
MVIRNKSHLQYTIGRLISKDNAYLPAFAKQLSRRRWVLFPVADCRFAQDVSVSILQELIL